MEVVTVLKELPINVRMVCGRNIDSHDPLCPIDTAQHQAAFQTRVNSSKISVIRKAFIEFVNSGLIFNFNLIFEIFHFNFLNLKATIEIFFLIYFYKY